MPVPVVGEWLFARVVAGYFAYHAAPTNSPALIAFRYHVVTLWPAQPKGVRGPGPDGKAGRRISPEAPCPASLAERAVCRQTPEVGAVCGNSAARICACGFATPRVELSAAYRLALHCNSPNNDQSAWGGMITGLPR